MSTIEPGIEQSTAATAVPSATLPPIPAVPGRVRGFVFSLVAMFSGYWPIIGIALAILGIVGSTRAMRSFPAGTRGRGLTIAGVVLGWIALAGTTFQVVVAAYSSFGH